jgi:hypothetical protein
VNYYWLDCPRCGCQLAINATAYADRISGSVRRWSADRSTNDGRAFQIAASAVAEDGAFSTLCVCGQELALPAKPSAVGTERDPNLRVTLGS